MCDSLQHPSEMQMAPLLRTTALRDKRKNLRKYQIGCMNCIRVQFI